MGGVVEESFAFIISHVQLDLASSIEIDERHALRRANDVEIVFIKEILEKSSHFGQQGWPPYENTVLAVPGENSATTYERHDLPRAEWKYWVITFKGQNDKIDIIGEVLLLLSTPLEIGFTVISHDFFGIPSTQGYSGYSLMPAIMIARFTEFGQVWGKPGQVAIEELKSIPTLLGLYEKLDPEFNFIHTAMKNFSQLRIIPNRSELIIVGLFSIIESLITHAPRLTESLDSINHQISSKIALLRKLYERKIVPENYFLHASEDGIWKKLYSYRSSVAHGTPVSFSGNLSVLKSRDSVVKFLENNIIEIIKLALKQPQFIFDLRRC